MLSSQLMTVTICVACTVDERLGIYFFLYFLSIYFLTTLSVLDTVSWFQLKKSQACKIQLTVGGDKAFHFLQNGVSAKTTLSANLDHLSQLI